MPDLLRVVRYDELDQLVTLAELESATVHKLRDTFSVKPGGRTRVYAAGETRRGGSRQVSERSEPGTAGATFAITAATTDAAVDELERVLAQADSAARGRYLMFKPQAGSRPVLYRLEGTGDVNPSYSALKAAAGYFTTEVQWPIGPLAEELRLDAADDFRPRALDDPSRPVNEVLSPQGNTVSAWFAQFGTLAPAPGTPPDKDFGALGADWTVTVGNAAPANPALNIGKTGPITGGFQVTPGERIGIRFTFRLDTLTAGTLQTVNSHVELWDEAGVNLGAVQVSAATGLAQTVSNPVLGTLYEVGGYYTVGAGVRYIAVRPRLGFAASSPAFTMRLGRAAFYRMSPASTTVPAYLDGDQADGRWEGAPGNSRSIPMLGSKLDGYSFATASTPPMVRQPGAGTGFLILHNQVNGSLEAARIVYNARRPVRDGQLTVTGAAMSGSGTTNYGVTAGLRYSPVDGRYIWATHDNGALRIYEHRGSGSAQNQLASVATGAVALGSVYSIRIRAEDRVITAELWTSTPTPTGAPTATVTATLPAGDAMIREGHPVISAYAPQTTAQVRAVTGWEWRPFTYKPATLPATIAVPALPGSAPAAFELEVAKPVTQAWDGLLVGWRRALPGLATTGNKSLRIPATGWNENAPASGASFTTPGGTEFRALTTNATAESTVDYRLDTSIYEADPFSDDVVIAVFARLYTSGTIVSPRLRVETRDTISDTLLELTPEYGSTGKAVTNGSMVTRFLGTLRLPVEAGASNVGIAFGSNPTTVDLRLRLAWGIGSSTSAYFAWDELYVVPVSALAMTAAGKAVQDGSYVRLFNTALEAVRRFRSDLSGTLAVGAATPRNAPTGMAGARLEAPAGAAAPEGLELLVRPGSAVDVTDSFDNPPYTGHAVHVAVTPRRYAFA